MNRQMKMDEHINENLDEKLNVLCWATNISFYLLTHPPKQEQNTHTKDWFGQIKESAVDRFQSLVWWLGGTWPSGKPTPYTNKQNNNMHNNVFVGGVEKQTRLLLLLCSFMVWWPGCLVAWWPGGLVSPNHQTQKHVYVFV